jgi:CheY-like chemotaxis protein
MALGSKAQVLVVDDDVETVEATAMLFEMHGAQVEKAYDGDTAIAHVNTSSPI